MKKSILTLTLLYPLFFWGQVGIKTTNPLQGLHVGGASSTVKIDGLSAAYNALNLGAGNTTRVFADANGDLILAPSSQNIAIVFDSENYLKDDSPPSENEITQHGYGDGFTYAGIPRDIPNSTFTLTKPAIIEINYSVSWEIEKNNVTRVGDGHARAIQTLLYFRQGSYLGPVVTHDLDGNLIGGAFEINAGSSILGGGLGISGQYYNNKQTNKGEYEKFHNNGTDYVKLPPGTYCPMFSAQLAVSDANSVGAMKMLLGRYNDEVQIIAHYYQ